MTDKGCAEADSGKDEERSAGTGRARCGRLIAVGVHDRLSIIPVFAGDIDDIPSHEGCKILSWWVAGGELVPIERKQVWSNAH
jgi:hypothetical protein